MGQILHRKLKALPAGLADVLVDAFSRRIHSGHYVVAGVDVKRRGVERLTG